MKEKYNLFCYKYKNMKVEIIYIYIYIYKFVVISNMIIYKI